MTQLSNDGGSAFPGVLGTPGYGNATYSNGPNGENIAVEYNQGMSLRDWFAGMAMQGIIQTADLLREYITDRTLLGKPTTLTDITSDLSHAAYIYADAMLAERSK